MTRQQTGGRKMAASNRGKLVTAFRHPVRVEVRRPKFERSASLAYIDVDKLGRAARAEFAVGYFEVGRCRRTVVAVVRRGVVTALRVEACAQCTPVRLTPERQALLKLARRRIGQGRAERFRPMPVTQFMRGLSEPRSGNVTRSASSRSGAMTSATTPPVIR